jgi:hypothetical protein
MGHLYPVGDIVAVVDAPADAERLVHALSGVGLPESDVNVVDGTWFVEVMRAQKESWNPIQHALALLASDEGQVVRGYIEQAEQGHAIVVVHAEKPEQWEPVARVLREFGAHHLRHYGRLAMTTL